MFPSHVFKIKSRGHVHKYILMVQEVINKQINIYFSPRTNTTSQRKEKLERNSPAGKGRGKEKLERNSLCEYKRGRKILYLHYFLLDKLCRKLSWARGSYKEVARSTARARGPGEDGWGSQTPPSARRGSCQPKVLTADWGPGPRAGLRDSGHLA